MITSPFLDHRYFTNTHLTSMLNNPFLFLFCHSSVYKYRTSGMQNTFFHNKFYVTYIYYVICYYICSLYWLLGRGEAYILWPNIIQYNNVVINTTFKITAIYWSYLINVYYVFTHYFPAPHWSVAQTLIHTYARAHHTRQSSVNKIFKINFR